MKTRSELTNEELALAYELRQAGCCWKRIAQGLGCEATELEKSTNYVVRNGLMKNHGGGVPLFDPRLIKSALTMHHTGFGWQSIADHLGVNRTQLRHACRWADGGYERRAKQLARRA